ncbi:MAG: hypothetical protein KME64_19290 [Scytonematopsis contorta HA4267-MV1]|jgi:uncharacterized protein YjbJ (UPF0337 family)|nr:hypothetical protein [Scytonematopsis contorta HA4267-MV1]
MQRIMNWAKSIRLPQILTAFVAGVLLLVTQACADSSTAQTPPGNSNNYIKRNDPTKAYDVKNQPAGGMNNFSDVDARAKGQEDAANAKAEALRENAGENLRNSSSNVARNVRRVLNDKEQVGDNIQQESEYVKDKTGNTTDDFARGVKEGFGNIKDNLSTAPGYVKDTAQKTAGNPLEGIKNADKNAARTTERNLN